jgi:hypothetical protein
MIVSPDKKGTIDPVVFDIIKHIKSEISIVPITRVENFEFNDDLLNLDRYIIADFTEYGWDWDMRMTHLFGMNTYSTQFENMFAGIEWGKFNLFVLDRQPLLYFKRELLSKDVRKNILPIEFPAFNPIPEVQSRDEFNKRLLQVANIWGLSHEARKRIHGDIWQQAGKHNYIVYDNIATINAFLNRDTHPSKWLTAYVPWYSRFEMQTVLGISGNSKITTSWPGAGRKCFRHTEASVNSVMAMFDDGIEWTWKWEDQKNCIKCEEGKEIETIVEALRNPYLYDIYREGIKTAEMYYLPNYISHLEKTIREFI